MVNVLTNASGTTAEAFRIGKGGPTILKGFSIPANSLGQNGDLYIRHGNDQGGLFYKSNNRWRSSGEFAEDATGCELFPSNSVKTVANTTSVVLIEKPTTYDNTTITWDQTDVWFGPTIITLPTGREGSPLSVKDLGGAASVNIYLIPPSGITIDGENQYVINKNYGSVSLIFAGGHWRIIGTF